MLLALTLAVTGPPADARETSSAPHPGAGAYQPHQNVVAAALIYPTITPVIGIIPFIPEPAPAIRVTPLPGTVALTFDDGPDPEWTPKILDILREHDATATFFALGWKVDAYPELAARIVEEGNPLQSHAYRHHNLTRKSSAYVASLISDTTTAIETATGTTPVCLRPPAGATSTRVRRIAAEHGQVIVLWSARGNSGDYAHHSWQAVVRRAATWEAGDVALMHDTWGFLHVHALPAVLADLEARGIGTSTICVLAEILLVPVVE